VRQVNFQSCSAVVPTGYVHDCGAGYSSTGQFGAHGWVQGGTLTAVSLVGDGKARHKVLDERLDTLMIVKATAPAVPPQWIMYVPNGTYDVTVAVGDPSLQGRSYVAVNGVPVIAGFRSSTQEMFFRRTVRVGVSANYVVLGVAAPPGQTTNTRLDYVDIQQEIATGPHTFSAISPSQATIPPADPGSGVSVNESMTLAPNDPVDAATITSDSIKLLDIATGDPVPGNFSSDSQSGLIVFAPSSSLEPFAVYELETDLSLRGTDGVPFAEVTLWFQTGTAQAPPPATFDKATFDTLAGPTVLQFGPDGRLYVGTVTGEIRRYDLDNTPSCSQNVPSTCGMPSGPPLVVDTYLNNSIITGLAFSDSGDATAPNVWVSRATLCDQCSVSQTGTISELSGANLGTARNVIVGLPRSSYDRMNNAIHFGPDGKLYVAQAAMTGYGAPDTTGGRSETPLSASILVADVLNSLAFQGPTPVNVNTDLGYDPTAPGAPLTVCAEGLTNPFDFVFHSNGHMYVPVNESSAGNTPAGPSNNPPALSNLPAGPDYLDNVTCGTDFYGGHPNPSQGHYSLMGGNPDGGNERWTWPQYPVGTQPDPNWVLPMYDIGLHHSPDGITEYTSGQFDGQLHGDLLMTAFSVGKDLIALTRQHGEHRRQRGADRDWLRQSDRCRDRPDRRYLRRRVRHATRRYRRSRHAAPTRADLHHRRRGRLRPGICSSGQRILP
jgi:hypothetical protein